MPSSPGRYSSLPILYPKSWINSLQDHSPIRQSNKFVVETPQAYTTESLSAWRPVYLSKRALAAFLMTFSALAAGAQIMLLLSKRNSGLSGVNDGPHRVLWRYGPTALLPASSTLLNSSTFPIWSNSCSFHVTSPIRTMSPNEDGNHFVGLQSGGCGGSSEIDDKRVAIIFAIIGSPRYYHNMTISKSNSLICKPTYEIRRLDFTSQSRARTVSPSKTANSRALTNVHPWHIMQSHLDGVPSFPTSTDNTATISNRTVYFDQYTFLAYLLANSSGNPLELSTIFETKMGQRLSFQTTTSNTLPSWLTPHLCNRLQIHWREQ